MLLGRATLMLIVWTDAQQKLMLVIIILQDGSVTNTIEFDREMVDLYQFSIRAQDNAAIPRFGFTTVSIVIIREWFIDHNFLSS